MLLGSTLFHLSWMELVLFVISWNFVSILFLMCPCGILRGNYFSTGGRIMRFGLVKGNKNEATIKLSEGKFHKLSPQLTALNNRLLQCFPIRTINVFPWWIFIIMVDPLVILSTVLICSGFTLTGILEFFFLQFCFGSLVIITNCKTLFRTLFRLLLNSKALRWTYLFYNSSQS